MDTFKYQFGDGCWERWEVISAFDCLETNDFVQPGKADCCGCQSAATWEHVSVALRLRRVSSYLSSGVLR